MTSCSSVPSPRWACSLTLCGPGTDAVPAASSLPGLCPGWASLDSGWGTRAGLCPGADLAAPAPEALPPNCLWLTGSGSVRDATRESPMSPSATAPLPWRPSGNCQLMTETTGRSKGPGADGRASWSHCLRHSGSLLQAPTVSPSRWGGAGCPTGGEASRKTGNKAPVVGGSRALLLQHGKDLPHPKCPFLPAWEHGAPSSQGAGEPEPRRPGRRHGN